MTPHERWQAWMNAMYAGDFETAWQQTDALRAAGVPDPDSLWNGEDLRGRRVVVRSLHGFGDATQMLRYAPMLQALTAEVVFEVDPRFAELARLFDGVHRVVAWDDPPSNWEVQVEVMELPYLFRTQLADLPLAERYLHLPEELLRSTAAALGPKSKPRVGIVWQGGPWNPDRSLPLLALEPLLALDRCEFWNLQGGEAREQLAAPVRRPGEGVLELAAIVSQLDLVITLDSFAGHLAGALGKPVWVMLHEQADWRWMTARPDSPWYPTMRLFRPRGPSAGWPGVVEQVCAALESCVPELDRKAGRRDEP